MAELTIQQGDTLGNIALAQGTTVDALLSANPSITDANKIQAGASLTVPGRALSGGAQPAAPGVEPEGRTPVVMDTDGIQQRVSDATGQIEDMGAQVDQRVAQQTERRRIGTPTQELNRIAQEQSDMFGDFKAKLTAFEQGAIPLTTDEQSSLGAIQGAFDEARKSQLIANRRAEAGGQILQQRTGRARFAPDIAQGEQQSLINRNIDKLTSLDIRAAGALADARTAIKQRNFQNILSAQTKLEDSLAQRQRTFADLRDAALRQAKFSASVAQMNTSGLNPKQLQKLMSNKRVLAANARIGVSTAAKKYAELVSQYKGGTWDFNRLTRAEKSELESMLETTLGPALSVAAEMGVMAEAEADRFMGKLQPKRMVFPSKIQGAARGIITGQKEFINNDMAFIDSFIPGATDAIPTFAEWKYGEEIGSDNAGSDFAFMSTASGGSGQVDDVEWISVDIQ